MKKVLVLEDESSIRQLLVVRHDGGPTARRVRPDHGGVVGRRQLNH